MTAVGEHGQSWLHCDPTLGRYLQPDPLINDDGNELVGGEPLDIAGLGGSLGDIAALNTSVSEGIEIGWS